MKVYDLKSLEQICKIGEADEFWGWLKVSLYEDEDIVCANIELDDDNIIQEIYVYTHDFVYTVEHVVSGDHIVPVYMEVPRNP